MPEQLDAVPVKVAYPALLAFVAVVAVAALPEIFPDTFDPAMDVIQLGSAFDPEVYTPFVTVAALPEQLDAVPVKVA